MRGIADEVRTAMDAGTFPFILAGNCNTSVGTISGLAPRDIGVVWFDAHGDFNTPEASTSGFIDGMGLAMLARHCWQPLATAIPGYAPVPDGNVSLVGARDFDDLEWERVSKSAITYLSDQDINNGVLETRLGHPLDRLAARVDGVYLHLDLDVHDATNTRPVTNSYGHLAADTNTKPHTPNRWTIVLCDYQTPCIDSPPNAS